MRIRQALVLVGGRGTRMWPLTADCPKPLIPLAGIPFLELQLRQLAGAGIEEAVLAVGVDDIDRFAAFGESRTEPPETTLVVEETPLDTAGPVLAALDALDEAFLVLNGDVLVETDLTGYLDRAPEGASGTLALIRVDDTSAYGVVVTDQGGTVQRFVEKPDPDGAPADTVNAGIYLMRRGAFSSYRPGPLSFEQVVFPELAASGELAGVVVEGRWIDIGTPSLYLDATAAILAGASSLHHPAPEVFVAPEADVAGRVGGGWAYVSEGVEMAAGATVEESVILPRARIEAGAEISNAVVGWDAVVGEAAIVRGSSMVGPRATIGRGCEIDHGARIAPDARLPEGSITFTPPD